MPDIYERILQAWGIDAQLGMVQEECAELIKVINKRWRGKASDTDLIEECVDVELMINQMKSYFKDKRNTWDKIKWEKLDRVEMLLNLVQPDKKL